MAIKLTREIDVLDFIRDGESDAPCRVVRMFSATCPHCVATEGDYDKLANDESVRGLAKFCSIDVKNAYSPVVLPRAEKVPLTLVYKRNTGCVFSIPGSGSLVVVKKFILSQPTLQRM